MKWLEPCDADETDWRVDVEIENLRDDSTNRYLSSVGHRFAHVREACNKVP